MQTHLSNETSQALSALADSDIQYLPLGECPYQTHMEPFRSCLPENVAYLLNTEALRKVFTLQKQKENYPVFLMIQSHR